MAIVTITGANFEQEVLQSPQPILLDFWAEWCGPCKMISPIVDELSHEMTAIRFGKINVDEEPTLAVRFGITAIPTLLLIKEGAILAQSIGYCSKEALQAKLEAAL